MDWISSLSAWPTFVLGLFVYVVVFAIRTILEKTLPSVAGSMVWRDIVLPTVPSLIGLIVALVPSYPVPAPFSSGGRPFYGIVVGFLSAWIYRVFKAVLKRQFGIDDVPPVSGVTR